MGYHNTLLSFIDINVLTVLSSSAIMAATAANERKAAILICAPRNFLFPTIDAQGETARNCIAIDGPLSW
jgi:hypothetical protein